MEEALGMTCKASKLWRKYLQLLDHSIIIQGIVACHTQYLEVASVIPVVTGKILFNTTFSINPKSSRTPTNTIAISRPVWDWHHVSAHMQNEVCALPIFATSTMSKGIDSGTPWCSKWMENAMNTLWLGAVQASVVKLNLLSYSWCVVQSNSRYFRY